jgi:hypothetical protein
VHAQRIRYYADGHRLVTEQWKNQAAYDGEGFHVDRFIAWRTRDGQLQIRVKWLGFELGDSTWEPVQTLHQDVPELVIRYLEYHQAAHPLLASELARLSGAV